MNFAQFIIDRTQVDENVIQKLESNHEKIGDAILQLKLVPRDVLFNLLKEYAKQEKNRKS